MAGEQQARRAHVGDVLSGHRHQRDVVRADDDQCHVDDKSQCGNDGGQAHGEQALRIGDAEYGGDRPDGEEVQVAGTGDPEGEPHDVDGRGQSPARGHGGKRVPCRRDPLQNGNHRQYQQVRTEEPQQLD